MVGQGTPPLHSVSVAGVVVDDQGRVLAIRRRDNGRWEPPGGVLELDESIEEGLVREIAEETGLTVAPEALTGAYKNLRQGIIALVFRCRVVGGDLAPQPEEVAELRWLDSRQVEGLMEEAYAARVSDAVMNVGPRVRAHDGRELV